MHVSMRCMDCTIVNQKYINHDITASSIPAALHTCDFWSSFCWNCSYSLGWYSTTIVTTVPAPFRHAAASSWVISSMFWPFTWEGRQGRSEGRERQGEREWGEKKRRQRRKKEKRGRKGRESKIEEGRERKQGVQFYFQKAEVLSTVLAE